MNYPTPDENPMCQCKGNPMKAFWCMTGHMTECHFPYNCSTAACSHLERYDFEPEEVKILEERARERMKLPGSLYTLDENNNVIVNVQVGEEVFGLGPAADPTDTPMASDQYFDPPDLPEEE